MNKYRVVLLDVDGVLLQVPKFFSHAYAEERGLDKAKFDDFFAKYATDVAKGKTDYRKLVIEHNDIWQWEKSPDELLDKWFRYENYPNKELIHLIDRLRAEGLYVYLATDQDKYRARYLKEKFKDMLDGAFISSEIKHNKREPEFFMEVVETLSSKIKGLSPSEIIFFDDAQWNIDSAKKLGIAAYLYKDVGQVKSILAS